MKEAEDAGKKGLDEVADMEAEIERIQKEEISLKETMAKMKETNKVMKEEASSIKKNKTNQE